MVSGKTRGDLATAARSSFLFHTPITAWLI